MDKVKVRLFGFASTTPGQHSAEIEIPSGYVIHDFLRFLSGIYGEAYEEEVFAQDTDGIRDDLSVIINGVITEHSRLRSISVKDGDDIMLLPIFPGGG